MSVLQSSILSETPLIEGNSVTLPIVKVGTKAYDAEGIKYTLTKDALENGAESWGGGRITVNHSVKEKGTISEAWFDHPYVYATLDDLSDEAVEAVNSKAYRGVSQESHPLTVDKDGNVTELEGVGVTLVFYPHTPACTQKMGCGVPIASTVADANADEERHDFDVATTNNVGTRVKIKEISLWLYGDAREDPNVLKERIVYNVGFDGLGTYLIFDRDDSLAIGDEIPDDRESVHTVTITVSNSPIFNFGLNTDDKNSQLNSSGGNNLPEDPKITELQSTIQTQDDKIKKLESENAKLKDDIAKQPEMIQSAVKAALDAHNTELAKQTEYDSAVKELSSFMKEETLAEFMKAEPSIEVIKSTATALKSTVHVGSGMGSSTPADDDVSTAIDELKASTGRN